MNKDISLPKELKQLLEEMQSGRHQWTDAEKVAYRKIVATLPPEKAAAFTATIPPPAS